MKKIMTLLIVMSCSLFGKNFSDMRETFLKGCTPNTSIDYGQEFANNYCNCLWDKVEDNYTMREIESISYNSSKRIRFNNFIVSMKPICKQQNLKSRW